MSPAVEIAVGALVAAGLIAAGRRLGRRERTLYRRSLWIAALIYLGFALWPGSAAGHAGLALELLGVAVFGGLAWLGRRLFPPALAAGWAAHALWDYPLHAASPYTPAWYPGLCLGFDLLLAAYIALAARRLDPGGA